LGMDPWIGQSLCCGSGWESFSGAVDLFNSVDDYAKGCYTRTVRDTYGRNVIHRLSVGCIWHVDQVSPAGCTSIQIVVTLGYE
jgi:hypothetical protein